MRKLFNKKGKTRIKLINEVGSSYALTFFARNMCFNKYSFMNHSNKFRSFYSLVLNFTKGSKLDLNPRTYLLAIQYACDRKF